MSKTFEGNLPYWYGFPFLIVNKLSELKTGMALYKED